jgi:O-antigen ligase
MTEVAAVLGAAGAVLVVAGRSRAAVLAGLAALAAAEAVLASLLANGGADQLSSGAAIAGLAVGVPLLAVGAFLLVRYPALFIPLAVALAPIRLPFELGREHRFFVAFVDSGKLGRLVPIYMLVAAGALALAWRLARGGAAGLPPPRLALPAAFLAGFTALSLLWAYDPAAGEDRLAFFLLPFAALLGIVARSPFPAWLPRVLALEAIALACLFAAVGIVEAWVEELLFADPKVDVANSYTSYFRVTSLFDDPSIYGRHLAIAIAVVVVLLWLGKIDFWLGTGLVAFLWVGLFFSYSQSSMVALAAAVVAVSVLVADRRTRRALLVAAVALAVVGGVFVATLLLDESAARVTSGRSSLASDTLTVVREHPLAGVGVASQPAATRDEVATRGSDERFVSHTTPLTVAAELGVVGVALYVLLLAGALWTFLAVRRRDEALGLALLAAFVVLTVHSLAYAVFFEDPLTWGVLGIAASYLAAAHARGEPVAATPTRDPAPARGRVATAG